MHFTRWIRQDSRYMDHWIVRLIFNIFNATKTAPVEESFILDGLQIQNVLCIVQCTRQKIDFN